MVWSPFNTGYTEGWTLRGCDIVARSVLTGVQLVWCNSVQYLLFQLELNFGEKFLLVGMNVWVSKMYRLVCHHLERFIAGGGL